MGDNKTHQAAEFQQKASAFAARVVPGMYWGLDPVGGTGDSYGVTPPAPAPTVGKVQEVWQTALYSATQAAALQPSPVRWPEIWGCAPSPSDHSSGLSPDCEMNGRCVDGACVCAPGWRGPRCSALKLGPTPRHSGFRHNTSSSWGGSIVKDAAEEKWHMFSSFILGECGLDDWSVNSEVVRTVADSPLGPYTMAERVAGPFAHEPNLAQGRLPGGELILLGTMNRHKQPPPAGLINCSRATGGEKLRVAKAGPMPPPKDTYAWVAKTPQGMAAAEPMLVLNSTRYDNDPNVHHTNRTAVCDTNLAGAILPNGSLVGVWRHCETVNLHTVPHSLLAVDAKDPLTYTPSNEVNCAHTPSRVGSLQCLTANCLQSLSSPTRARKTRTSTCRATWCTRCCMTSRSRAARTARSAAGPAAATPSAWIMGAPSRIRRSTHGVR